MQVGRTNGISPLYAVTFPIAATLVLYSMVRSMVVTLRRGGVDWRGTFYSLAELREHMDPAPGKGREARTEE